jgi:next-to-BRCA1 protein 1
VPGKSSIYPLIYADLLQQCGDYDLCGQCLPLLASSDLHPVSHTFKAMLHPGLEERIKVSGQESESRHNATCDLCSQTIIGVRLKCLDCYDWDSCQNCASSLEEKHPGHSFVKLHKASDYVGNAAVDARENVRHPHVICDGTSSVVSQETD